jgi:hypothetical protein
MQNLKVKIRAFATRSVPMQDLDVLSSKQCDFGPAVDNLEGRVSDMDTQSFRRPRGLFLEGRGVVTTDDGRAIPRTQHANDAGRSHTKGVPDQAEDQHGEMLRGKVRVRLGGGNRKVAAGQGETDRSRCNGRAATTVPQQRTRFYPRTAYGNDEKQAEARMCQVAAMRRRLLLQRHLPAVIALEEVNGRKLPQRL